MISPTVQTQGTGTERLSNFPRVTQPAGSWPGIRSQVHSSVQGFCLVHRCAPAPGSQKALKKYLLNEGVSQPRPSLACHSSHLYSQTPPVSSRLRRPQPLAMRAHPPHSIWPRPRRPSPAPSTPRPPALEYTHLGTLISLGALGARDALLKATLAPTPTARAKLMTPHTT